MRAQRLVLLGIAALAVVASPARAATSSEAAAEKLAARYVPIAMLREQTDPPCKTSEEQYQPTSVLSNPTVTLTHELPDGTLEDVKRAPTAADVAGLRDGFTSTCRCVRKRSRRSPAGASAASGARARHRAARFPG